MQRYAVDEQAWIPVPGGVGVAEFGLTLGLTSAGMEPEAAVAAVLLYRRGWATGWFGKERPTVHRYGTSPTLQRSPSTARCEAFNECDRHVM